jgi:hypothetical protein
MRLVLLVFSISVRLVSPRHALAVLVLRVIVSMYALLARSKVRFSLAMVSV